LPGWWNNNAGFYKDRAPGTISGQLL